MADAVAADDCYYLYGDDVDVDADADEIETWLFSYYKRIF